MIKIHLLTLVVLAAGSAAAAQSSSGDAAFARALAVPAAALAARSSAVATPASVPVAASAAAPQPAPDSCGPAPELETSYALTAPGAAGPITLAYAGCRDWGRNDYEPGYTERYYQGPDGFSMMLVTDHGDGAYPSVGDRVSEVLVSQGQRLVVELDAVHNAKIVSGAALTANGFRLRAERPAAK